RHLGGRDTVAEELARPRHPDVVEVGVRRQADLGAEGAEKMIRAEPGHGGDAIQGDPLAPRLVEELAGAGDRAVAAGRGGAAGGGGGAGAARRAAGPAPPAGGERGRVHGGGGPAPGRGGGRGGGAGGGGAPAGRRATPSPAGGRAGTRTSTPRRSRGRR